MTSHDALAEALEVLQRTEYQRGYEAVDALRATVASLMAEVAALRAGSGDSERGHDCPSCGRDEITWYCPTCGYQGDPVPAGSGDMPLVGIRDEAQARAALAELTAIDEAGSEHEKTAIVAALALYGEKVNLPALVERARALNEAKP